MEEFLFLMRTRGNYFIYYEKNNAVFIFTFWNAVQEKNYIGTSLGIMEATLRDPHETPNYHSAVMSEGFQGGFNWALMMTRDAIV